MKTVFAILLTLACTSILADEPDSRLAEWEASAFFNDYLDVYNRRFGHPERSEQFRSEISTLVNFPVMQSPPTGLPFVTESKEDFGRNFEGFLIGLEKKGVSQLVWKKTSFHALSPNKVLANNIGHGVDDDGNILYETVSLYLLVKGDDGWRISLFSPYLLDNDLQIQPLLR